MFGYSCPKQNNYNRKIYKEIIVSSIVPVKSDKSSFSLVNDNTSSVSGSRNNTKTYRAVGSFFKVDGLKSEESGSFFRT